MILSKLLRITPITDFCREEYQYAYVWNKPYECVDCSYLYMGKNRKTCLINIREYVLKLWYINPDATSNDLIEDLLGHLKSHLDKGVFITETDICDIVFELKNNIPTNVSEIVKTKSFNGGRVGTFKKIEWKNNLNGLLVIPSETMNRIRKNGNLESNLTEEYRKIKLKYAMKCIAKTTKNFNEETVNIAVDLLREDSKEITVKDVSSQTGLSINTVKEYLKINIDRLNSFEGVKVIINSKVHIKDVKFQELLDASDELIKEGKKVNKLSLHKKTNISRITIARYWNELNAYKLNK